MARKNSLTELILKPAPDVSHRVFSILDPVHQLKIEHYIKKVDEKKREKLAIVLGVTETDLLEWQNTHKFRRFRFVTFATSKFIQTGNASWATFVTALRHPDINETKLASEIATKHHAKTTKSNNFQFVPANEVDGDSAVISRSNSTVVTKPLKPALNVVDRKFSIFDPIIHLKIENCIKNIDEGKRDRLAIVLGVTNKELNEWQSSYALLRVRYTYFITSRYIHTGNASWATFVTALRHPDINETKMADEIASGHCILQKNLSSTLKKDSRLDFEVHGVKKIPRISLTLESVQIDGGGVSGDWYRGTIANEGSGIADSAYVSLTPVSIKESIVQLEEKERFVYEGKLMRKLRHENIVELIGVCVDDVPLRLITEFVSDGNLHLFLRRASHQKSVSTLTVADKVQIALYVAKGCQYLQEQQIIHRDISARSCFILRNDISNEDNNEFTVKIGEFGSALDLSLSMHENEQFMDPELPIRIKWCAPEAYEGETFFKASALQLESDIWSYGVLLYEIVTLCKAPYPGLSNKEVTEFVLRGKRMAQPNGCHDTLYELMQSCWEASPDKRVPFIQISQRLTDLLSRLNSKSDRCSNPTEDNPTYIDKPRPQFLQSMSISVSEFSSPTINKQKRKIEAQLMLSENRKSQGIIYIVGIYGADGTEVDVQNMEATFKELNFTTFVERNPSGEDIVNLVQAAAEVRYPYRYQYIAFYFAGHGGIDEDEKNFILGLPMGDAGDGAESEVVYVDEYIVNPLKCLHEKKISRLFFFDCCQSKNEASNTFRSATSGGVKKKPKPHPGEIVAYATNQGEKSWGDKTNGGIWTYCLCKNLRELYEPISTILSKTYDDVAIARNSDQQPCMVCSLGVRYLKDPPTAETSETSLPVVGRKSSQIGNGIVVEDSLISSRQAEPQRQLEDSKPVTATDVCRSLEGTAAAYYWGDFAIDLSIDEDYRESLYENVSESDEEKLEQVIERWINKQTCEVSWAMITRVAKDLELDDVAERLEKASKTSPPIIWDSVYNCLRRKGSPSWSTIASRLNISPAFISKLQQDPAACNDRRKLEKVIKEWLDESKGYEPTWEKIIEAVKEIPGLGEEVHALELMSTP